MNENCSLCKRYDAYLETLNFIVDDIIFDNTSGELIVTENSELFKLYYRLKKEKKIDRRTNIHDINRF